MGFRGHSATVGEASGICARFLTGANGEWFGELSGRFWEKTNIFGPVEMGELTEHTADI